MKILSHIRLHGGDLRALYGNLGVVYPKFFKMDGTCRLGFVASEMLLGGEADRFTPREDTAVLIFTHSGSLDDDRNFEKTTRKGELPSPALFVYTLPNSCFNVSIVPQVLLYFLGHCSPFFIIWPLYNKYLYIIFL